MEKDLKDIEPVASKAVKSSSDPVLAKEKKTTGPLDSKSKITTTADTIGADLASDVSEPVISRHGTHIVTADSVQAEEVPTIPLESLQTISSLQPEISVHSIASSRSVRMPTPLVVQSSEYRRSSGEWLQLWWDGVRPAYLPLSLLPALLGSVLAWTQTISIQEPFGHFYALPFIGMIVSLLLLQIGAHLVNDYYDYLRGIDTSNALGPGGLIQQGLIRPSRVLSIGLAMLILGTLSGLIVASAGGPLAYLFGLVGLLCAYFYSAPPRALSALGLGELIAFVVFGPLITIGAYMVQGGHGANTFVYSLPLGLIAAAVILVNNMRDAEGDMHAGKHTIASLTGIKWSRILFVLLVLVAYTIIIFLGVPHNAPHWLLITLWTFPLLVIMISGVVRTDTPAGFDLVMHEALKLEIFFGGLLLVGLVVQATIPVLPHIPAHLLPF